MLSRLFLFRFLRGMSIPCVFLGMNEVAWQETRGMMHANIGQESSGVGVGVAPAGTVVEATAGPGPGAAGPNSGGNNPHTIPAAAESGASSVQVPLSGRSQDDATVGYFFQRQAGQQFSGYFIKHHWPTRDSIHVDHSVGSLFFIQTLLMFPLESISFRKISELSQSFCIKRSFIEYAIPESKPLCYFCLSICIRPHARLLLHW